MSSTQYRVRVREASGTTVDLEFRLVGSHDRVYPEPAFLARVVSESLPESRIRALWPDVPAGDEAEFAWSWMTLHAAEVVDPGSIVLHDERDHPLVVPSESRLLAAYREAWSARWEADRAGALAALRAQLHDEGARLAFEDEPWVYDAATLDDVLHELVSARFEALGRLEPRASVRFRVRDRKWIAHLAAGDTFDSIAWPT